MAKTKTRGDFEQARTKIADWLCAGEPDGTIDEGALAEAKADGWYPETTAKLLAQMRDYDGYQLLPKEEEGVQLAQQFAAGLGPVELLQFIAILARAPGNAYSSR